MLPTHRGWEKLQVMLPEDAGRAVADGGRKIKKMIEFGRFIYFLSIVPLCSLFFII